MSKITSVQVSGYGIPIGTPCTDDVRERAQELAKNNPALYSVVKMGDEDVLQIASTNNDLFQQVHNWVIKNEGIKPV